MLLLFSVLFIAECFVSVKGKYFSFLLKQAKVGAEQTSLCKSLQNVGVSKAKLWLKCFLICVQMGSIEEAPGTFLSGQIYLMPYLPQ